MSKKAFDLSKRLNQPSFGVTPELVNPLAVMPMMIELENIDPYHRNPRRSVNPKKAEIKASILELGGLEQPLPVTRIDGETRYFIYKGGNTRLSCLKELWQETGDTRFAKVRCEFHPYEGTSQALLAHLRENDLRGDISFIDKALALQALRDDWEKEYCEKFTLRSMEEELKRQGMPVDNSSLSKFFYAARLHQFIPKALESGMGRPQIAGLSKLERSSFKVWAFHQVADDKEAFFHEVFGKALQLTDRREGWKLIDVADAIKQQAVKAGIDPRLFDLNMEQAKVGDELTISLPSSFAGSARKTDIPSENANTNLSSPFAGSARKTNLVPVEAKYPLQPTDWKRVLQEKRKQAFLCADSLTRPLNLPQPMIRSVTFGYGFLVTDLISQPDSVPTADSYHSALFWFLVQCSQTVDSSGSDKACPFHAELSDEIRDHSQLHHHHPMPSIITSSENFWLSSQVVVEDALDLIRCCREIRQLVDHNSTDSVWEVITC